MNTSDIRALATYEPGEQPQSRADMADMLNASADEIDDLRSRLATSEAARNELCAILVQEIGRDGVGPAIERYKASGGNA